MIIFVKLNFVSSTNTTRLHILLLLDSDLIFSTSAFRVMPLHSSPSLNIIACYVNLCFHTFIDIIATADEEEILSFMHTAHISSNMTANTFASFDSVLHFLFFLYLVVGYSSCAINGKNAKSAQHLDTSMWYISWTFITRARVVALVLLMFQLSVAPTVICPCSKLVFDALLCRFLVTFCDRVFSRVSSFWVLSEKKNVQIKPWGRRKISILSAAYLSIKIF